jgi:hypothetical protein
MVKRSIRNRKKGRNSRKNRFLYGGSKKIRITINLNLSYVDEELDQDKLLDPTSLSEEYRIEMENHLKDIIPSNSDFKLSGKFNNSYTFIYNNTEEYYINFQIVLNYDGDDLTIENVKDTYRDIFEGDYPFTSEDEMTYFINTNFDVDNDIELI